MAEKITCAVVMKHGEDFTVDNMIVFDNLSAVEGVRAVMGFEYLIPVDAEVVRIGDMYDTSSGFFTRNGVRIFPELTEKERIDALEKAQNETEQALMELAQMIGG